MRRQARSNQGRETRYAGEHPNREGSEMERVSGIGGFFFSAREPDALSRWYETYLGIAQPPTSYDGDVWVQEAGPTIFAPFGTDQEGSPHLGPAGWGLNFRVRDLDAMVSQLADGGVEVQVDAEHYPNGRFAQFRDPEGNAVQLWEPAG